MSLFALLGLILVIVGVYFLLTAGIILGLVFIVIGILLASIGGGGGLRW